MKQTFNLHTHTWRCGHAEGEDYEYIENAIERGFQCLGFSEHIQYRVDNGKYNRIDYEDFISYFKEINLLKEIYKEKITILCGLEAAYVPEAMLDLLDLLPYCDFVLLGHHQGGLRDRKYALSCTDEELEKYTEELEKGIFTGIYDIVAHPDFFMNKRSIWNEKCEECAYRICNAAKKQNIPLELNIKGSYAKQGIVNDTICVKYPYRNFWKIAAEVGNDVLYGIDAHSPSEIYRDTVFVESIIHGLDLNMITEWNNSRKS